MNIKNITPAQPNVQDILFYEQEIEFLLNHNMHRFRYIGEEGREYETVCGVFSELNKVNELSNKNIRWYAIIVNLWMSFQQRRYELENKRMGIGSRLTILDSLDGINVSLPQENSGKRPGITAQLGKEKKKEFYIPTYIQLIEDLVNKIARLGMLIATKKIISPPYLDFKLTAIPSILSTLLNALDCKKNRDSNEEIYELTIHNALKNALKLCAYTGVTSEYLTEIMHSPLYQKTILNPVQGISPEKLSAYYNLDIFWNGFIP